MLASAGRGLLGLAVWILVALPLLLAASCPTSAQPAVYVWVEAEQPAEANTEFQTEATGRPGLLSDGKWLRKSLDKNQAQAGVPEGGFVLRYGLQVPEGGEYELWARVGFEWARAPLEWRLGEGQWTKVGHDVQTTNVMELGEWMEVAWLKLGEATLRAGAADLQIRWREPGGDGRMLMALDCIALTKGKFVPEGRLKPGEQYDSDVDRQAAETLFELPPAASPARAEVKLSGLWQVARYDDADMDQAAHQPLPALPAEDEYPLRWMGLDVPKSLWSKDETIFAHRVIYRTRVNIPAGHEGRGFYLHFSGTNWLVSVFVNGELAGTHRGVWIPWDLDISRHVQPGKVNEIAVAIKGPYYAVDVENYGDTKDLDRHRNRPRSRQDWVFWIEPIYPSTKGDGDGVDYGIVNPVTLVSVGDAYTEDVFIKPSVAEQRLEADVTVRNAAGRERELEVLCEAVYDRGGQVEKSFGPVDLTVPAGDTAMVTLAGQWTDPKLWWPKPDPDLYRLRTTISEAGKPIDVQEELFGFREVTIEGTGILINGVRRNFWNWVGVHGRPFSGEEWLTQFREESNRFTRFSQNRKTSAFLATREERLEFYDRNGIPGRLCSMIDGMFISRTLGQRTKDEAGEPLLIPNQPVWEGFRRHMEQLARAYRNHPSVIFYQVENELVYITGMNIYGGYLDRVEELMSEVVEAAREIDPTRPYTVGGAGDLSGKLEINDPHYPAGSLDYYPDNAYELTKYAPKIERWPWERNKPWVVGESAHAGELQYGSYVMGDEVFRGPDHARRGKARYLRMLYGGYRWAGVAGFFPWDNLYQYEDGQKVFSDLCVIPRKQTHRLFGGRENRLLFKVMNDTLSAAPVAFAWSYEIDGQRVAGGRETLQIEPGFGQEQTLSIAPPETDQRLDGVLTLRATQPEAEDYVDMRSVPVLPVVRRIAVKTPVTLLDRSGKLEGFLGEAGLKPEKIEGLADAKGKRGILLIGPDTLTADEAFGQDILAFAAQGGRAIVLEQEIPAAGANLPAPLTTTTHYGGYAHPKALGTPLFRDLGADDFIDWAGDHPTCKNVYEKPLQGGRTLVESGGGLTRAPLVEMPCGKGAILLCQLRVGAKLGLDPAADVLLRNMVEVYADYQPATGVVAVYAPQNALLVAKVKQTGALAAVVGSVDAAVDPAKHKVAVIGATAESLAALNAARKKAEAFQAAGGWIMLSGLDRDGLQEFNKLLGTNHLLRPFRLERVTLESPHFPLVATLGNRELAMYSTEAIAQWRGQYWVSPHAYATVVDGADIAPFCRMPGGPEDIFDYTPTRDDKDPYNFVNGLLNSEFWRYICQIWVPEEGAEPLTFTLPRPESIAEVRIWNNANYWTIKDLDIIFDDDEPSAVAAVLPDSGDLTAVKLPQPRRAERTITLQIRSWRETRPDRPDLRLVGIDNVQFLRAEPPQGAVFIDNVGGLVAYPRGEGGVFLNQLKFMEEEPSPANADKKLRALGVILQNMGAGSRASTVAVPGVNVRYEPVNITDYCNQFITERAGKPGWFGERGRDLRSFRVGEQVLANVTYHPVDYATAPVPHCIMLGARGAPEGLPPAVEGLQVGRRADLLFFLHAARVTRPVADHERERIGARNRPFVLPEVVRYVIRYADGETAEIPVVLEKHVDHWLQDDPRALEGAQVAWAGTIEGVEDKKGALYSMQAPNPRPEVEIETIDVVLPKDQEGRPAGDRAIPALLAITLGTVIK